MDSAARWCRRQMLLLLLATVPILLLPPGLAGDIRAACAGAAVNVGLPRAGVYIP